MPPTYFFHLKLELYPAPAVSNKQQRLVDNALQKAFLPPQGSDIFKTPLPAHTTSRWSSHVFKGPTAATSRSDSGSEADPSSTRSLPQTENSTESYGDALLLPESSFTIKSRARISGVKAYSPAKLSNEHAARDWRYGRVSIESIDMEVVSNITSGGGSAGGGGGGGVAGGSTKGSKSASSGLHTKALFVPSDPKTTELGWGVVHLYQDTEEDSIIGRHGGALASKGTEQPKDRPLSASSSLDVHAESETFIPEHCTTLCILAVPSWMMPSELLGFVGDQAREDVSHFRLIRTARANKYMVLMKFRSAKKAREWQKANNGRLFTATEPENCHVVFIKSVNFVTPGRDISDGESSFPQNDTNDPFTRSTTTANKGLSNKPLAPPPPNLLELPTCPVCLERMDETTGLLTILCQHVFHCACLEKWRGSGCPVCRYTHSPSYTFPYPRPTGNQSEEDGEPVCSVCTGANNLWVCLICGNIGCGRYDDAHAFAHYDETSHCYAMDINTQHVWDYAGDGYVHRLIQSKPDSKTIDLPSSKDAPNRHENEAFRSEGDDMVPRGKMESMANEYTYLLTSQLEGQRAYFEEQVERAVDKASQATLRAEVASAEASKAAEGKSSLVAERDQLNASLTLLEKNLEKSERARRKFEQMARDLTASLKEERLMNDGLVERMRMAETTMREVKDQLANERKEKEDLKDLNHDLQQFISGSEKVKELQEQGEEVEEGGIGVLPKPESGASSRRKGKGKKRG